MLNSTQSLDKFMQHHVEDGIAKRDKKTRHTEYIHSDIYRLFSNLNTFSKQREKNHKHTIKCNKTATKTAVAIKPYLFSAEDNLTSEVAAPGVASN